MSCPRNIVQNSATKNTSDNYVTINELSNYVMDERFLIDGLIGVGSGSYVFKCRDMKNTGKKLALKVSNKVQITKREIKFLREINKAEP